jgi:hypothetical protein
MLLRATIFAGVFIATHESGDGFCSHYFAELEKNSDAWTPIVAAAKREPSLWLI